jgi:hypothetical protein
MTTVTRVVLLALLAAGTLGLQPQMPHDVASNEVFQRQIAGDSLLSDIMSQCFQSLNFESMTCMRVRVLMYMNQLLGEFANFCTFKCKI